MGSRPKKQAATFTFRVSVEDRKLMDVLHKKLGVLHTSEILRQGLRALATKEGVAA